MFEENGESINALLCDAFAGKIVRKDLTKKIKEGANVPVYVLEYLLGKCKGPYYHREWFS
ncbi:MAG: hypothetical protein A4E54_01645 [Pelotomaculum sp. PtaB.Bin117]|nr:MAG: hypothetical protein A4E54_01645 [Pelotomaculum sp. PtaB.Bin117]OPY59463.1 MAG: hypothetical protein A4E56_03183 [Pelotomaculum sp. PtaU1.Bin065]